MPPRFLKVMSRTVSNQLQFLEADIDNLIKELTLDEKISLISSPDWWNTNSIKRLGIPSVRMSDGPNVRSLLRLSILSLTRKILIGSYGLISICHYTCTMSSGTRSFYHRNSIKGLQVIDFIAVCNGTCLNF